MDPICHTLAGAALGESGLARRTSLGLTTLILAANAPDIDVFFPTGTLQVYSHRGWTHGVLGTLVLPVALTAVMLVWDRLVRQRRAQPPPPADARMLLLLALAAAITHPCLDFMNSYGIRLLAPFSDRWFYGDALYIVDPWMYLLLGGGILAARWGRGRGAAGRVWAARTGLGAAAVYVALMAGSNLWARHVVETGLTRAGVAEARFMVTPVFANPLRREVIVDTGDRYERGFLWFEPAPHFRPAGFGVSKGLDEEGVSAAMLTPTAQQFLYWSRFPFFIVDRAGAQPRVFLNDYRYATQGGRGGWAAVEVGPADDPLANKRLR
jgi:inner membrane protein